MALYKNQASQKIAVYAYDTAADAPETGDAANITAQISLDGGATAATNDTNPTELDAADAPGIYIFDLTQAETNGDLLVLSAVSATADVKIEPVIIYTSPGSSAGVLAVLANAAHGGAAATLLLSAMSIEQNSLTPALNIHNAGGEALNVISETTHAAEFLSLGGNGHAIVLYGDGAGSGLHAEGGASGHGIEAVGNGAGHGLLATGGNTGGSGLQAIGGASAGPGISAFGGTGDGPGIVAFGDAGNADGMRLVGFGTGKDLNATTTDNLEVAVTGGAPTAVEIADAILTRDWTAVTGEASRSVLNALRAIRNRVRVLAGTMTVYEEDDAATAWTAAVTTDAAADAVTEIDPS